MTAALLVVLVLSLEMLHVVAQSAVGGHGGGLATENWSAACPKSFTARSRSSMFAGQLFA